MQKSALGGVAYVKSSRVIESLESIELLSLPRHCQQAASSFYLAATCHCFLPTMLWFLPRAAYPMLIDSLESVESTVPWLVSGLLLCSAH